MIRRLIIAAFCAHCVFIGAASAKTTPPSVKKSPSGHPVLLLWMHENQSGRDGFVHESDHTIAQLTQYARRHGFALTLPQWDTDDLAYMKGVNLSHPQAHVSVIRRASDRYQPDVISVMNMHMDPQGSQDTVADVLLAGKHYHWAWHSPDTASAATVLIDRLSDVLAQAPATIGFPATDNTLEMQVVDIDNAALFDEVDHYLRELSNIKQVQLVDMNDKQLTFRLTLAGSAEEALAAIRLNGLLVQQTPHEEKDRTVAFRAVK